MAFEAGTLLGRLKLDLSGFTGNIIEAQGLASAFGSTFTTALVNPALAGFELLKKSLSGFVDAFTAGLERIDDMGDVASRLGVSTEFLTELQFAAEESGSSLDGLTGSLDFLNRTMGDVASGAKKDDPFAAIGVSIRDTSGQLRSTEQVFKDLVPAINNIQDPAARSAAVVDILGRSGTALLPTLLNGAEGLAKLAQEARDVGFVIDGETVQWGDALNDARTLFDQAFVGLQTDVARGFFEGMGISVDQLRSGIVDLAQELRPLAQQLGELAARVLTNQSFWHGLVATIEQTADVAGFFITKLAEILRFFGLIDDRKPQLFTNQPLLSTSPSNRSQTSDFSLAGSSAAAVRPVVVQVVQSDGREIARKVVDESRSFERFETHARGG